MFRLYIHVSRVAAFDSLFGVIVYSQNVLMVAYVLQYGGGGYNSVLNWHEILTFFLFKLWACILTLRAPDIYASVGLFDEECKGASVSQQVTVTKYANRLRNTPHIMCHDVYHVYFI